MRVQADAIRGYENLLDEFRRCEDIFFQGEADRASIYFGSYEESLEDVLTQAYLIDHRISHLKLDNVALRKALGSNESDPMLDEFPTIIRGWFAKIVDITNVDPTSPFVKEFEEFAELFFQQRRDLLREVFPGSQGVSDFYEIVKGTLYEKFVPEMFALQFQEELDLWISSGHWKETGEGSPLVCFDEVNQEIFESETFWEQWQSALIEISHDPSRKAFAKFEVDITEACMSYNITDRIQELATKYKGLDDLLEYFHNGKQRIYNDKIRNAILLRPRERALEIISDHLVGVDLAIHGTNVSERLSAVIKAVEDIESFKKDPENRSFLGRLLVDDNSFNANAPVKYRNSYVRLKSFGDRWKEFGFDVAATSIKGNFDGLRKDDRHNRQFVADLVYQLYSPAADMSPERHRELMAGVINILDRKLHRHPMHRQDLIVM